VRDYGLRVSPRVQQSPLWKLSPRGFRLWVYLAMKSQHAPQTVALSDGQRIKVQPGQWLTSARKLQREVGGSAHTIVAGLQELQAAGVIEMSPIPRSKNCNTPVAGSATGRSKNCNAHCVMATLVTIAGMPLASDPVAESATKYKDRELQASPVSLRDQREWDRAQRILEAEGR
jgi:DNA-binding transcriptional MocR family regulator